MEMKEVKSSNIKSVGFSGDTLQIEFKNGKRYLYHEVPKKVYNELLEAESVGRYANKNIFRKFSYSMPLEQGGEKDV